MNNIRIIPRLDIKGPNLVKGIHLEGLRVMGKPEEFARYYYENGADELMFMDVVASLYERNSLHDIIKRTAREIFIPLTVGGGLRSIDDIRNVLRAGADKVSLNTAVINNPNLIREASKKFGSSTIVVAIEAIRQDNGKYLAYTDNAREYTGMDVLEWARKADEMGAGEIVLTSVDREGTGVGFDMELTRMVTDAVSVPVIAHGGAGNPNHILDVVEQAGASAVAIASILHYDYLVSHPQVISAEVEGNREFLKSGKNYFNARQYNLTDIKHFLMERGLNIRPLNIQS
jgi:cyclase